MVADGGQDGVEGGGHGQLLVGGGGVVERVGVNIHRRHQPRHRPAHRQPRSLGITGRHLKIEVSAMFRESFHNIRRKASLISRNFIENSYIPQQRTRQPPASSGRRHSRYTLPTPVKHSLSTLTLVCGNVEPWQPPWCGAWSAGRGWRSHCLCCHHTWTPAPSRTSPGGRETSLGRNVHFSE